MDDSPPPPDPAEAVRRAERARDWDAVLAAGARLPDPERGRPIGPEQLAMVRALHQLGRAGEAHAALTDLEAQAEPTPASRELAATIASLFGQHEAAAAALAAALARLPPEEDRQRRRLLLAQAEEWLLLGRADQARAQAIAAAGGAPPSYGEMSLLRRSIRSVADREGLFALLLPYFHEPGVLGRAALFQYSMACRDGGAPHLAIAAARARFLLGTTLVPFGAQIAGPNPNWTREGAIALADVLTDLGQVGERPFLVSGTFLGHVRDGGLIGHDKDIDLGLFAVRPVAELRAALATTGRFRVRPSETDRLIQVRHANGVVIDLFLHWSEDGRILHEGQKGRWWNSPFQLVSATFLDHDVLIPDDAERYLEENYGPRWREPDPLFETFIDTPNLVMPPDDHMRWYYFARLHDLYAAGRIGKIEKVWARLQPLLGADQQVERVIARIRAEAAAAERIAARMADVQ